MAAGTHSQATFIFGDAKLSVVYAANNKRQQIKSERHKHSQYEIYIFDVGSGYLAGAGKRIKFARNTLVIIPPNTHHEVFSEDNDPPIAMTVTFSYKKAPTSSPRTDAKLFSYLERLLPKEGEIAVLRDKYFGEFIKRFLNESEPDPTLASVLIINLLEGLILNVIRLLSGRRSDKIVPLSSYKTTSIANDAVLARNLEDYMIIPGCTLTTLAQKLNMCPRNTEKVLKKIYGMTFSEKIAEIRLTKAIKKMETTDLSLTEIAREVGYNQYPSFRHAFIKAYGMRPSEYREKLRDKKSQV